jgi:adenylate kinase family enzyme
MNLGKKIVIIGVSASGKSTFARQLGAKTNLPIVFTDAIMWNPGWAYIGDEETVQKLKEESSRDEWIIEGYISKDARTFVLDCADTIIYLDYPRMVAAVRYIKRWWKHRKNARPELEGSPENFDFKFLKVVWTKAEARSFDKFLGQINDQGKIIRLYSPREAENFLKKFQHRSRQPAKNFITAGDSNYSGS